jgi:uncharacterized protein (TIGR03067 family)
VKHLWTLPCAALLLWTFCAELPDDPDLDYIDPGIAGSFVEDTTIVRQILDANGHPNLPSMDVAVGGDISGSFRVVELNLGRLHVSNLQGVGGLKALRLLNIDSCQMTQLPGDIGFCENLRILQARWGSLGGVDRNIGQLPNLTELDLAFNNISLLPPELANCAALKKLFLRDNELTTLPDQLAQLTDIQADFTLNRLCDAFPGALAGWLDAVDDSWRITQRCMATAEVNGSWVCTAAPLNPCSFTLDSSRFYSDEQHVRDGHKQRNGVFMIDPTRMPKHIDFTVIWSNLFPDTALPCPGIYRLRGPDTLEMIVSDPGTPRALGFADISADRTGYLMVRQ